jgi:PiT family inorganic phosphate transporter
MPASPLGPNDPAPSRITLGRKLHPVAVAVFFLLLIGGFAFAGYNIFAETREVGAPLAVGAFLFLGLALFIALGFEFVNGFHDTANAVATVIYTHSLQPVTAVVWSGLFNFLGVIVSSGAVAYSIITLLPVDLILHVGSAGGYAMIFALLIAAVLWNLGTWWLGLPNSSSHALIGSILGVGFANQLINGDTGGTSGVEWEQAYQVLLSLFISPVIGFVGALLLLRAMKQFIRKPELYQEPVDNTPPPFGIRSLLVFTCTAISFAHGSNDGQKGMGLIKLILIGMAPAAYALNRTMPDNSTPAFIQSVDAAHVVFAAHADDLTLTPEAAPEVLTEALRRRQTDAPEVYAALDVVSGDIVRQLQDHGAISHVPATATRNLRNQMYLVSDALNVLTRAAEQAETDAPHDAAEIATLRAYQRQLESSTRYIPIWVKISVALALGLGTMVGWKRIVITVGEKIGKTHLTYGMGASAGLMAASTILLAGIKGLPVSTTHILSSGVAGAMVGNGSGFQKSTMRNIVLAWFTTLPAAMFIAGLLYALFLRLMGGLE